MITRVGAKIQQAVETYMQQNNLSKDIKKFEWEYNTINENIVNAWCMPGGKVVVGIILVNSNPKDIASLILFSKATYRKMIQNLIWATGYNVVAIPLAAGVLYKWGILLTPAVGAVFMSVSTIIVAINAKLLKVKTVSKK